MCFSVKFRPSMCPYLTPEDQNFEYTQTVDTFTKVTACLDNWFPRKDF